MKVFIVALEWFLGPSDCGRRESAYESEEKARAAYKDLCLFALSDSYPFPVVHPEFDPSSDSFLIKEDDSFIPRSVSVSFESFQI